MRRKAQTALVLSLVFCALVLFGGASSESEKEVDPAQYCDASTRIHAFGGEPVYVVGEDRAVSAPARPGSFPNAEYPVAASKARLQGMVVVELVIGKTGEVVDTHVCRGLPLGLTEAALAAVRQWRFSVTKVGDDPVQVSHVVGIDFHLRPRRNYVYRANTLYLSFDQGYSADGDFLLNAGLMITRYVAPEMRDDVRTSQVVFTDKGAYFNGQTRTQEGLNAFMARLRGLGVLGEPTLDYTKQGEDGSLVFRISLNYPDNLQSTN